MRRLDFIELGLSDFCQNRCVMCHQSKGWFAGRERRFLDAGLARALADDLRAGGFEVNALYLFWIGEPLLHPDFPAILAAFFEPRPAVRGFVLNTNGQFLAGDNLAAVLAAAGRADFSHVIVSLDSADPATYARIRVGGDHGAVLANLSALLAGRRGRFPLVIPQMVVMEENAAEIDAFVAAVRALGAPDGTGRRPLGDCPVVGAREAITSDAIYLRPLLFDEAWLADPAGRARWEGSVAAWREALARHAPGLDPDRILARESADPRARPDGACRAPFAGAVVTTGGRVVPCCGDYFEELPLGDLSRAPFTAIWEGAAARDLRARHIAGDPAALPARCRRCYLPAESRMKPAEAAEKAREYGIISRSSLPME